MKPISCNQRNGRHRKALCPGSPQGTAWYHYDLLYLNLGVLPHHSCIEPVVLFEISFVTCFYRSSPHQLTTRQFLLPTLKL